MPPQVRARTASGCTPLHLAARGGKASVIEALLHAGALVGDVDARRATALHFAATMCRAEACRALLEAGAVVTAPTEAGESAVDKAKGSGHGALAEVLTKIAALQEDGLRQEAALVIAGLDERCTSSADSHAVESGMPQDSRSLGQTSGVWSYAMRGLPPSRRAKASPKWLLHWSANVLGV